MPVQHGTWGLGRLTIEFARAFWTCSGGVPHALFALHSELLLCPEDFMTWKFW